MAVKIWPVMCSISLLPITSKALFMAAVAATLTCFLVSHMHAVTSGTISGRQSPDCLGAVAGKVAMQSKARSRICHFFSTGRAAKSWGRRDFMAKGSIFWQIAMAASLVAATMFLLLAIACSKPAKIKKLNETCSVSTQS